MHRGTSRHIDHLLVYIDSPERTSRVSDFSPRTSLATDTVGNVNVHRSRQRHDSFKLSVTGDAGSFAEAEAGFSAGKEGTEAYDFQQLPELQTAVAAGTVNRGHGVYFKLRSSTQTTLEGQRPFRVTWTVSDNWRADYVRLTCRAIHMDKRGEQSIVGSASFLVAMYLEGDQAGRQAAEQLVRAEQNMLRVIATRKQAIQKRGAPTLVHELSIAKPGSLTIGCTPLLVRPPTRQWLD